jgi:hypothetical protein
MEASADAAVAGPGQQPEPPPPIMGPDDLPPMLNEEELLAEFRAEACAGPEPVGVIGADPVLSDLPPLPNEDELLAEFRAELAGTPPARSG